MVVNLILIFSLSASSKFSTSFICTSLPSITILSVNRYFDANLATDQFDTIGGVVMNRLGKIPQQGEELKLDDFLFQITRSDGRRILSMDLIVGEMTE